MRIRSLRQVAPAPMQTFYWTLHPVKLILVAHIWALQIVAWALLITAWVLAHAAALVFNWIIFPVLAHARYRRAQVRDRKAQVATPIGRAITRELPEARTAPVQYPPLALPAGSAQVVPVSEPELVVGPNGEVSEVTQMSDGSVRVFHKLRAYS